MAGFLPKTCGRACGGHRRGHAVPGPSTRFFGLGFPSLVLEQSPAPPSQGPPLLPSGSPTHRAQFPQLKATPFLRPRAARVGNGERRSWTEGLDRGAEAWRGGRAAPPQSAALSSEASASRTAPTPHRIRTSLEHPNGDSVSLIPIFALCLFIPHPDHCESS